MMMTKFLFFQFGLVLCLFLTYLAMSHFNISTLNLNGARDVKKRANLFELIKLKRFNVMMVQETHSDTLNETEWRREWEGEVILSHLSRTSGGVALLFSKDFIPKSYALEEIIKGRLMVVRAKYELFTMVFINAYAPNVGPARVMFLNELNTILNQCGPEDYLFLGGDFNCTENDQLDRNHIEPHIASKRAMKQLVETHHLIDIWREIHGKHRQYTWVQNREKILSMARLDRFYCFKHNFNIFKECRILPVGFSDHSLVSCSVFISNVKPKSAYWHFNTALLLDAHFRETFIFFWENFRMRKDDFASLKQWWDHGKVEIKQLCQQYTFNVSHNIAKSMRDLETEIVELQISADSTGNPGCIEDLKLKKTVLADLLGSKAQGALVRSRFQSAAMMDSPSKFFFSLERKNGQSRFIHALRSTTGQLLTETSEIRQRAVGFYSELYHSDYTEDEESFDSFCSGLPRVSEEANKELEGPLTTDEMYEALQSMQVGKAPGIDGLQPEFYIAFWNEIREDILEVFNESLNDCFLPQSCRRAVLTLLPKKGDLQEIKNWRPVSLLCADYKLLSKVLANRLKKVMDEAIHQTQTYCVPGRSIVDNVSLIRDILEVSSSFGFSVGLLSLDQEKAFDRVEHRYLWKVLTRFGLSPGFIAKIMVMYENIESVLKFNGSLCTPFKVSRGIRQGCSMSGMLYALSIEPMLQNVRSFIEGLFLPGFNDKRFILSAYADDIIVIVKNQKDVTSLDSIVKTFGKISAAKVNWDKSEAIAVGSWPAGLPQLPGGLRWKRGGIKYLGVYLGDHQTVAKNWEGVEEKVEGRLAKWRWLLPNMSYRGRVLIINNLVASTLWHRLMCMEPPPALLQKVQSIILKFFWDNLHWVPQSVLYLPKEEGGQGLVHLRSRVTAFRLQFIQRYLTGGDEVVWKPVMSTILRGITGLGLDSSLFLTKCVSIRLNNLNPFYQGIFKAWTLFKWNRLEPAASLFWLLKEPLIYGARLDVQDDSRPGLTQRLISAGAVMLKHVVDVAGPGLNNVEAVASLLGLRSHRHTQDILDELLKRLSSEEHVMLQDYFNGTETPDEGDPFPELGLEIDQTGLVGPLLVCKGKNDSFTDLYMLKGKAMYKYCVKALNKKQLNVTKDTVWRETLQVQEDCKPVWRLLYKHPLNKRSGDLQWRILKGALAVNNFVSKMNPAVLLNCPFCPEFETIFHCYLKCKRLEALFEFLKTVFLNCGEEWSETKFIFGAGYKKENAKKWQLLNFVVGQAKLSIYKSRKNKIENVFGEQLLPMFKALIKARIRVDFGFYSLMSNVDAFMAEWCITDAICTVVEEKLIFNKVFL